MYPVSATFKDKIKLLDQDLRIKVQIQHSQGVLNLDDSHMAQGGLWLEEKSQGGDDFVVGGKHSAELHFEFFNKAEYDDLDLVGATVLPSVGLVLNPDEVDGEGNPVEPDIEWVPLGVFNVDEVTRTKTSLTVSISAFDNMILLDKPYSLSQLVYPATLKQIYLDLCSICDVLPGTVSFPNDSYVVTLRPDGDLTCRDVLGYVAELAGCFARATRDGKIELAWYSDSGLTLTGANRFSFVPRDDVVRITGVMATVTGEDGDVTYLAEAAAPASFTHTDDSKADFEQGTLGDVVAGEDGLELKSTAGGYTDNLIPEMTSDTTPSGSTSASAVGWPGQGYDAYKAMDKRVATYWCTPSGVITGWIEYQFASAKRIAKYAITSETSKTAAPKDWTFEGWDGSEWVTLHTVSGSTGWASNERREFTISLSTISTTRYRLNVSANNGHSVLAIAEIEMMEVETAGYAESGTLTSPAIDLSGVGTATTSKLSWTATTPTGTSVTMKTSLSTDGGATWSAWAEATNGGGVPGIAAETDLSNALLKYRATLQTTDTAVTPILESVTITIGEGGSALAPYLVDLSDNPLLQSNYESAIAAVYNAVKDTAFHPFTSGWQGNPAIQAGDMLTQVDRDENEYPTLVTHSTYRYRGESTLEARGLPVAAKGFKGSTNKRIAAIVRKVEEAIGDRLTSLEQATLAATELIANMLGGHVIQTEDAVYICDAETLETSTKIWKWGLGGFGYSDDGGETYTTAITADGTIVAALVAAGLVTADMIQAGILQSQTGSTSINLNTGLVNIQNKVYFDPTKGEYIFDGLLSAKAINALKGEIDVVVSYTTITQVLAAEKGNISELTVDQLDTSDMVQRYLNSDTSNVNFIRIYGQNFEIIEGTIKDGAPTAQLLDRKQRPLYWLDAERTGVTLDVTPYPVTVYQYDLENRKKLTIGFEIDPQTGNAIPRMIWGAGDQNDYAKGYILKDETGLRFRYQKASGDWVELALGENGIEGTNAALTSLDIYSDGMISEYDDGTVYDWSWVKDVDGKITSITNNTLSKTATITWNAGNKP